MAAFRVAIIATFAVGAITLVACDKSGAVSLLHRGGDQDPCTLLSAAEATQYVGRLASPPYRADDGSMAGNVDGERCLYRGADGRQLSVLPNWKGGGMVGGILGKLPDAIGRATANTSAKGLDSMARMVLQSDAKGPWDNATWIPGGSLFVYKGDAQIVVDVSGASGNKADALAIGRVLVPRIGHPLNYDGAQAVALAPKVKKHPARLCDLLSRRDAEAAVGPLTDAPAADGDDNACTYRVSTPEGERSYPVEVVWEGGQKNYNMLNHGMSTVAGMLGTPGGGGMDSMNLPPEAKQMLGGLIKMMGDNSGAKTGTHSAATGAVTQVGLKTDTTLKGPWDHAALLHGTQLIAVKNDVFVGMTLQSADYEKAKALMAAICSRL